MSKSPEKSHAWYILCICIAKAKQTKPQIGIGIAMACMANITSQKAGF